MIKLMIVYCKNNVISKIYMINPTYKWVTSLMEYFKNKCFYWTENCWIENKEDRGKNHINSLELIKSVYYLCRRFTESESINIMVNWRNQLDSLEYLDDTPDKDGHELSSIFDYFEENKIDIDNLNINEDIIIKKRKWNKKYENKKEYEIFIMQLIT